MYEDKIEWFEYYSSVILNENNFLLDFIYLSIKFQINEDKRWRKKNSIWHILT